MIEIKNVSCRIKDRCILNTVSCGFEEGKLTAVIGPNGSGKSTLLKCIMRFIPYSGEILIAGKSLSRGSDLAKKVSYLSQTQNVIFPHTVFDIVLMGRRPHAPYYYTKDDSALAERCIERMGLAELKERPINRLSGGEQQKTFFARALAQDTEYMLFDEPFNNTDPSYQMRIIEKLRTLKRNKTIIVVLHDTGLLRFFDNVVMIKNGEIRGLYKKGDYDGNSLEALFDSPFGVFSNGGEEIIVPIAGADGAG